MKMLMRAKVFLSVAFVLLILAGCTIKPDALRPYPTISDSRAASVGWKSGDLFPNLAMTNPQGENTTIADLRGKPLLINFWATWCRPCRKEMPSLNEIYPRLSGQGLTFVFLNMYEKYELGPLWANEKHLSLPLYDSNIQHNPSNAKVTDLPKADGSVLSYKYNIPTTFLVDRNGVIVKRFLGDKAWKSYEAALVDFTAHSATFAE